MTPQAEASLARARRDIDEARLIASLGLHQHAAPSAYYAAFHAAEALIVERTGRIAKTHRGVHTTFSRVTRDGDPKDRELWRTLPDAYRYKELADYSIDPDAIVSALAAATLMAAATRFVARVTELLAVPPSGAD